VPQTSINTQVYATWNVPEELCSWNTSTKHGAEIIKCGSFQNYHALNLSPPNGLGVFVGFLVFFFFFGSCMLLLPLFLLFKGLIVLVPTTQKDILQMREKNLKVV